MEAREDEAADAVPHQEGVLARGEAHLRLRRRPHALHAPALVGHDLLDRRRRVHRHRHDPGRMPHRERHERREEVHVVHDAAAIIDDEHLLATGVDDHAERRPERRHQDRELALLLLKFLERAGSDVLGHHAVHRDDLDAERIEQLREELRDRAVRIVDDDPRLRLGDLLPVGDFREERLAVRLADPRGFENPPDVLVRHATEVLAEKDRLDLPFLSLVHVERLAVEELDVANAHVERRHTHVHAPGGADAPRVEPPDRKGRLRKVGDMHTRTDDPAHEPALQHAARAMLVAVHRDRRAELERRRVRRSETGDELGGEVDVDDAGHAKPAE